MDAPPTTFEELVNIILGLINIAIPAILAVVFLIIVWKLVDAWVINGGDLGKREEGKQLVVIGVLVFVLMISFWGVIALLRNTFFGS